MFKRQVWAKGFGIAAVAAVLAVGGLAVSRASTTSAQGVMWYDPVLGMTFTYQDSLSAYPINVTTNLANEPVISTVPSTTYVAPFVSYVAPTFNYTGVPAVVAAPFDDWSSPGGNYCTLTGGGQVWIPNGSSPASEGC
ncbi:MAG TPA: hypothetical protein VK821_17935 [Dehalococcoidia bacterium]|nr:hypothetical protein [Dehalococcoidia bacterium]